MAERESTYGHRKFNRLRHPVLTVKAYAPNFQPDGADAHMDISAMDEQIQESVPNRFLRPDFAWRRPHHQLGEIFPITAYGESSTYSTKVLGVDAPALQDANIRLAGTNIYLDPKGDFDELYPKHLQFYKELFAARGDIIVPVLSSSDLTSSLESKPRKTGAILTLEGIYHTDRVKQPEKLVVDLSKDGIRSIMPVHNLDNDLGTSHSTKEQHGLTMLGKRFVQEALRQHRTIDLSHASTQTGNDVLAIYDKVVKEIPDCPPPIISHTGSRDRVNITRNTPDEIAIEIARRGGLIGVMPAKWIVETEENNHKASVKSVVDLIDYYLQLFNKAGVTEPEKRIAIGTDFDGMGTESIIPGLESIQKVGPALYREMLKRKMPHKIIRNILSKNTIDYYEKWLPE